MKDLEVKTGGYTFKAAHIVFITPILSALAGGIYYSYDAYQRFLTVESSIQSITNVNGRVQALEQTVGNNNVADLSATLAGISTQMTTILEQQRTLLDLKSKVERSELITDGIDERLEALQVDINSVWSAIDELGKPL